MTTDFSIPWALVNVEGSDEKFEEDMSGYVEL